MQRTLYGTVAAVLKVSRYDTNEDRKRKRSDASNWLRSKRHFPESWRQKLKKMPEAMPLIKVDHKRNTEESNDGGDIIVNDLIQQNNEEKERAVKDRY